MTAIRSGSPFLVDNQLMVDKAKDPVSLEGLPSKPTTVTANADRFARLARSAWAGWQGTCTTFGTAAVAHTFFGPYRLHPDTVELAGMLSAGAGILCAIKAYNNYSRPENLTNQSDSLKDESSKPTIQQKTGLERFTKGVDRLTDSAWVGLRTGCSSFVPAALISDAFRFRASSFLPLACGAIGTAVSLLNLVQKRPENLTDQPEGRIQTAVKSIFKGFVDGSTVIIPGLSLLSMLNNDPYYKTQIRELTYISSAVFFMGSVFSNILNRSRQESAPAQPVSRLGRLKNICQIAGSAALSATVPFGVGIPKVALIHANINGRSLKPLLIGISAITALASSIESYYSSRKGINPELRIRKRFLDTFSGAFKTYSAATLAGLIVCEALLPTWSMRQQNLGKTVVISSAILGTAQGAWSFFQKPRDPNEDGVLSTIYQKWKSTSKVTKLAVALTSLAAMSVVYLGGPNEAYKFGNDQYHQTYQSVNEMALKTYQTLAFNTKSDQQDITLGQLAGFSDKDEMERLADLATTVTCLDDEDLDCQERTLMDLSCAQILQTCHLDASAIKDHKDVYKSKYLKFHPDKNPKEKALAELASQALSQAHNLMKDEKECSGQDENSCKMNAQMVSLTRKLLEPNKLFKAAFGLNPTCTFHIGDNIFVRSVDDCKDL